MCNNHMWVIGISIIPDIYHFHIIWWNSSFQPTGDTISPSSMHFIRHNIQSSMKPKWHWKDRKAISDCRPLYFYLVFVLQLRVLFLLKRWYTFSYREKNVAPFFCVGSFDLATFYASFYVRPIIIINFLTSINLSWENKPRQIISFWMDPWPPTPFLLITVNSFFTIVGVKNKSLSHTQTRQNSIRQPSPRTPTELPRSLESTLLQSQSLPTLHQSLIPSTTDWSHTLKICSLLFYP